MSFLHPVRLAFAGRFQADVSTVNNDVRHYDRATFEPVFQQLQEGDELNGWWNPTGSGGFRLVGCRVTGAWYADGSATTDPAMDPVIGTWITGAPDRAAAQLVDLDPQWQLASAPWGLAIRASDAQGAPFFSGEYKAHPFRDLWFGRFPAEQGDAAASSTFQSVVDQLRWDEDRARASRFLSELRRVGDGRLSIRLATFGFDGDQTSPTFTLGTVVGCIGPQLADEPESFLSGRRFVPASQFASWAGITYFGAVVDRDASCLLLDLSNALTIADPTGTPAPIGRLMVGLLRDPSIVENTPVSTDTFVKVAEVPYQAAGWLAATGGVFSAGVSPEQLALADDHPLALVAEAAYNPGGTGFDAGDGIVAIRESPGGLSIGAEPIVVRIDAPGRERVTFHAAHYGAPLPKVTVMVRQVGPVPGQGGGQTSGPHTPRAPIPDMGVPMTALTFPAAPPTDSSGMSTIPLVATDPGNPRRYIDGQVYLLDYRLPGQGNTDHHPFDMIAVHVRDAVVPAERPTWDDVEPVLGQYANVYPVMRAIVDLGDEKAVKAQRDLLRLAFSLPNTDPNAMPATRDLSEGKRRMIVAWLDGLDESLPPAAPRSTARPVFEPAKADATSDSKARFAAGLREARVPPGASA
jgi:hypothetical protein